MWNSALYSNFWSELHLPPFMDLMTLVTKKPNLRVVDLGCGHGDYTRLLADSLLDADVLGIDSSPEVLRKALHLQTKKLRFELRFVEDVVELKNKWDLVFSSLLIHWIDDHEVFFPKLISTVADGGQLVLQMSEFSTSPLFRDLWALADKKHFKDALNGWKVPTPVLDIEQYAEILHSHGGKDITVYERVYPVSMDHADLMMTYTLAGIFLISYLLRLPANLHQDMKNEIRKLMCARNPEDPRLVLNRRILMAATF